MTFDEYQKQAKTTAHVDPDIAGTNMEQTIWAMGISGEAGEVLEKWKKIVAYKKGVITEEDKVELEKELGDIVWYISMLADSLNLSFDQVMQRNVEKLQSRKARGKITGQGDNR
jgi:NTP pyrophosphatase (non-canonical NTP hydrolase)